MREVAARAGLPGMKRTNTNLMVLNPGIIRRKDGSLSRRASAGARGGTELTNGPVDDHNLTSSATPSLVYLALRDESW